MSVRVALKALFDAIEVLAARVDALESRLLAGYVDGNMMQ